MGVGVRTRPRLKIRPQLALLGLWAPPHPLFPAPATDLGTRAGPHHPRRLTAARWCLLNVWWRPCGPIPLGDARRWSGCTVRLGQSGDVPGWSLVSIYDGVIPSSRQFAARAGAQLRHPARPDGSHQAAIPCDRRARNAGVINRGRVIVKKFDRRLEWDCPLNETLIPAADRLTVRASRGALFVRKLAIKPGACSSRSCLRGRSRPQQP